MANLLMQVDVEELWQMYSHHSLNIRVYQCGKCACGFGENAYTGRKRDASVFCPSCGLAARPEYVKDIYKESNLYPLRSRFSVKETKDKVILECVFLAGYKEKEPSEKSSVRYYTDYKKIIEIFCFDIKTGKTTWHQSSKADAGEVVDITNLLEYGYFNKSLLSFFTFKSHGYVWDSRRFTEMIKCVRDKVKQKIEAKFGRKMKNSMFVQASGHNYGVLLPAIKAISIANSLPYFIEFDYLMPYHLTSNPSKAIANITMAGHSFKDYFDILAKARDKADIAMWTNKFKFPDTSGIRSRITKNMFISGRLEQSFLLFANYDHAIKFFEFYSNEVTDKLKIFLHDAIKSWGEKKALDVVLKTSSFNDVLNMYEHLNKKNRALVWEDKIQTNQVHDFVMNVYNQQVAKERNYSLKVDKAMVRRFEMTVDDLNFVIPQTSEELHSLGVQLHNCVASYAKDMLNRANLIVMAKKDDVPVICIQLIADKIVQAKLNRNVRLCNNESFNDTVLKWAARTGIGIKNLFDVEVKDNILKAEQKVTAVDETDDAMIA